jgi:large subunit ribosomal protein L4
VATLKKYDLSGKEVGTVQVDDALLTAEANSQMVKDYLVAIRNNARQWSANTKGRKEISCTGRKPHAQKGQGKARQGSVAAPQYKGGGIVFGPKPKFNQHVRINRKERKAAIRFLIAEKIKADQVRVLQSEKMDKAQTKVVAGFLRSGELMDKRVLFLGERSENEELYLSSCNIKKKEFSSIPTISGYDLALCREIVVLDSAVDQLLSILG